MYNLLINRKFLAIKQVQKNLCRKNGWNVIRKRILRVFSFEEIERGEKYLIAPSSYSRYTKQLSGMSAMHENAYNSYNPIV